MKGNIKVSLMMATHYKRRKSEDCGSLGTHMTQHVFHREIHLQVKSHHDNGVILEMDQFR